MAISRCTRSKHKYFVDAFLTYTQLYVMKLLSPSMSIGIARVSPLLSPTFTSPSSHAKLFCRHTIPCKFAFSSAARGYPYSAKRAVNVRRDYGDDGGFAAPSKFPRPESVPWQKELTNTVHLIGYVGKSVEMRYTQTGKAFARTSLEVKTSKGEETTWSTLNFWEELAEIAAEHLKARDRVYVSGSLHVDKAEGKDNNICTFFQVAMLEELEAVLGSSLDSGPQVLPPQPLIIVISGPSGVGKDAVIKRLQEMRKGIHFVVTATTRAKRPGEVDGKDYFFVSKEEFLSMIEKNELLEHALVYGDYKGVPKQQIRDYMSKGYDIVLRVDVQGAATLRSILGNSALFIFIVAESEVSLVKRLMGRKTETMEKLVVRVSTARDEVKRISEFDYAVVNAEGQLDRTVNLILSILDAEKAKVQQRIVNI